MKRLIGISCVYLSFVAGMLPAAETNSSKDPLQRLVEGNKRFVTSTSVCHSDWTAKRAALAEGQRPFAVVVSCSDSRVPPEIVFDQSLGDIFVVRLAGNIVDDFALGSIEYGVQNLGASIILVLGHANCGAVSAALKNLKFDDHIQAVVDAIHPAIKDIKGTSSDDLEKAIKANAKYVVAQLKNAKPAISRLVSQEKIKIVAGYYRLDTGAVDILD